MTQRLIPERMALVLWPRAAEPIPFVCTIGASLARAHSWIADQRGYVEFETWPVEVLARALHDLGLDRARLGIEQRALSANAAAELRARLPAAALEACDALFDAVRMVKSKPEIDLLAGAARVTDAAIARAWAEGGPDQPERELANRMLYHLLEGGADSLAFLVFGAGDGARMAHPAPRPRRMRRGGLVRVDFAGSFGGYYSDLARMGVIDAPTRFEDEIYRRPWQVHHERVAALRPGVPTRAIVHACRAAFERQRLNFSMPTWATASASACTNAPCCTPTPTPHLNPIWCSPSSQSIGSPTVCATTSRTLSCCARTGLKSSCALVTGTNSIAWSIDTLERRSRSGPMPTDPPTVCVGEHPA
ncbi:MAG TPA: hypothetical protein DEP84_19200, partial [Chloroflexi bacterium]|nr:hypothetical protein [Chloroflexota bacterium]